MPQSMRISSETRWYDTGCREAGTFYVNRYAANHTGSINTCMVVRSSIQDTIQERIDILDRLLSELQTRVKDVKFETRIDISTAFQRIISTHVTLQWTDNTDVVYAWWWSSLLQRIVMNSPSYTKMADIRTALSISETNSTLQWASIGTKKNTIKVWDDILLGVFDSTLFREFDGPLNGLVSAHNTWRKSIR